MGSMILYVYDSALTLCGVVSGFSSLRWRRKYFEPGETELHLPVTAENIALLEPGRYLIRKDAVEAAVITGVRLEGDDMTVTGRMLSQLLGRRVIYPRMTFTGTAEEAMRQMVINATAGERAIGLLAVADAQGYAPAADFTALGTDLTEALTALARSSGLGYRIKPDVPDKQLLFEVYQGLDRSKDQAENPRVVLNDAALLSAVYTWDGSLYKNLAYVYTDTQVLTVDQADGAARREVWVDGNDINRDDYTTTAAYTAALVQRGVDRLAELPVAESFESGLQAAANGYKTAWDLGDIITVRMTRWNKTASARVTEVEEIYEGGTAEIIPVLGSPLPERLMIGDGF